MHKLRDLITDEFRRQLRQLGLKHRVLSHNIYPEQLVVENMIMIEAHDGGAILCSRLSMSGGWTVSETFLYGDIADPEFNPVKFVSDVLFAAEKYLPYHLVEMLVI